MSPFTMKLKRDEVIESLTDRELEVLEGIIAGKTREQISNELFISKHTYDEHRKRIRAKLRIRNFADWVMVIRLFL